MRITTIFLPLLILLALMTSGCASTTLKIYVDLYKGKTEVTKPWTSDDLGRVVQEASTMRTRGDELATQKLAVAKDMKSLYDCYYHVVLDMDSVALQTNDAVYHEYASEIEFYQRLLLRSYGQLKNKYDTLSGIIRQNNTSDRSLDQAAMLQNAIALLLYDMVFCIQSLSSLPLNGSFERVEFELVEDVLNALRGPEPVKPVAKGGKRVKPDSVHQDPVCLREGLRNLSATIKSVVAVGQATANQVSTAINAVLDPNKAASRGKNAEVAITNLMAMKYEYARTDESLAHITRVKSLLESQNYRLEDLADPIWKKVTTDSERSWKRRFSRTRYKAQGNSSVVIVKDDPATFRVMQGTNNPAALLQGQLQITRAIANVGIKITSAYLGIKPTILTDTAAKPESDTDPGAEPDADAEAKQSASSEMSDAALAEASERQKRNFRNDLSTAISDLSRTGLSAAERARLQGKLVSILKTYQLKYK
jgi:hypothetical protein